MKHVCFNIIIRHFCLKLHINDIISRKCHDSQLWQILLMLELRPKKAVLLYDQLVCEAPDSGLDLQLFCEC